MHPVRHGPYGGAVARPDREWHVLLIGGASGVGKTTVAAGLGQRFGVNLTQLDDIQTALETLTTPKQQPLLHFWRTHWSEFSAFTDEQHVAHFLDVSRQVYQPVLDAVVGDRLDGEMPTIIEGDFILPGSSRTRRSSPVAPPGAGCGRCSSRNTTRRRSRPTSSAAKQATPRTTPASRPAPAGSRRSGSRASASDGAHRPSRHGRGRQRPIEPSRRSRADSPSGSCWWAILGLNQ